MVERTSANARTSPGGSLRRTTRSAASPGATRPRRDAARNRAAGFVVRLARISRQVSPARPIKLVLARRIGVGEIADVGAKENLPACHGHIVRHWEHARGRHIRTGE